jgi:hypothetical protein
MEASMLNKKMVEVDLCSLYMSCICGITWKLPFGREKGSFKFDFQCDGPKGCNRFMFVNIKNNRITNVSGVRRWWLKEVI